MPAGRRWRAPPPHRHDTRGPALPDTLLLPLPHAASPPAELPPPSWADAEALAHAPGACARPRSTTWHAGIAPRLALTAPPTLLRRIVATARTRTPAPTHSPGARPANLGPASTETHPRQHPPSPLPTRAYEAREAATVRMTWREAANHSLTTARRCYSTSSTIEVADAPLPPARDAPTTPDPVRWRSASAEPSRDQRRNMAQHCQGSHNMHTTLKARVPSAAASNNSTRGTRKSRAKTPAALPTAAAAAALTCGSRRFNDLWASRKTLALKAQA